MRTKHSDNFDKLETVTGEDKNIGWAKTLIFLGLLRISSFLGSAIGVFISVSLIIGWANAHPAHLLP